jgi:hypothetical protein
VEVLWSNLKYYPAICLKILREPTENFSEHNWFPGQNFNMGFPEYKAGVVTTQLQ